MPVIIRLASPEYDELKRTLFKRYPKLEWATFAHFGWRVCGDTLVLSLAALDMPHRGELDERVGHVAIQEPYTLRIALSAEQHPLAVGVIHSHPKECIPRPSLVDDDMDTYYASYFDGFTKSRPYVSLIFSEIEGRLCLSGRVFWQAKWHVVNRFVVDSETVDTWVGGAPPARRGTPAERTIRLSDAFGEEAADRLRHASVAVIGAGGTGSAAIEVLARAGVGKLVIVDPDHLDVSNLERVHGSTPEAAKQQIPKVIVARDHVKQIDSTCEVHALIGALPQSDAIDALVQCDLALGCTDQQHSRLALSDIAVRYLIPALDCGVVLEGEHGRITGQVMQFVRFLPADSCALCRGMVNPGRLQQELVSPQERQQRQQAAAEALRRGENPNPYWHESPQLNTVGYLTTAAGSLVAGYAIGMLTGRFAPPFERLQMNVAAPFLDVTDSPTTARDHCTCRRVRGWADQAAADALIWPPDIGRLWRP